jgi:nicotinate phosphoribosyltransferase
MFDILKTDFYQISMAFAYTLLERERDIGGGILANTRVGFEAFVRKIKPEVAVGRDYYIFSGEKNVIEFMEKIKDEIRNPLFPFTLAGLIAGKIKDENLRRLYMQKFFDNFEKLDLDFEYNVYPEFGKLFPYVPAFQYYGPVWIGQLIETYICNLINGRTGYESLPLNDRKNPLLYSVINIDSLYDGVPNYIELYCGELERLKARAAEYRNSTGKALLEAAFRRAPSLRHAINASKIAMDAGWNGTSNLAAFFEGECPLSFVNGTMAHSFVMLHRVEKEAYVNWNKIFPNSTILIDTYDVMSALEILLQAGIKPAVVRVDSDPIDGYAFQVRAFLDKIKWNDTKIFISGDLTPEVLRDYEERGVPFDMCMAGTKYANIGELANINAGFVYKIVQSEDTHGVFYPEKKATGKKNYTRLKRFRIVNDKMIIESSSPNFCKWKNMDVDTINRINSVEFNIEGA